MAKSVQIDAGAKKLFFVLFSFIYFYLFF